MSEELLRNLIKIFAILAKLEPHPGANRPVVERFLRDTLEGSQVDEWLLFYDKASVSSRSRVVVTAGSGDLERPGLTVKDSSRLLIMCTHISAELDQRQRLMILFILFSFIKREDRIPEAERDFLISVADVFTLSIYEFSLIERFALCHDNELDELEELVIIKRQGREVGVALTKSSYLMSDLMDEGTVTVLRMPESGIYLARCTGQGGLLLNGVPMRENVIYALDIGSSIEGRAAAIGPIYYSDIVSRFGREGGTGRLTFEARNISYRFGLHKVALHPMSILEESGRLVGLMGPSGAGKSTLLEVLNGNLRPSTGQVLINGQDIHVRKDVYKGLIGYVPQDDLLIEELTVYDNLYYAARLTFGTYTEPELDTLVLATLAKLGLTHTRYLRVGSPLSKSISGGERKRVNIGLELLRAPQVLFVDEPTSGLSSRDSINVMELLKALASEGKLVFVVIHQPSSDIFKLFDRLVMLDTGGYIIYQGNPIEAIRYFKARTLQINRDHPLCHECGNVNPEQIFDIVETRLVDANGNYTSERRYKASWWHEQYQQHLPLAPIKTELTATAQTLRKAGYLRQLATFISRDIRSKLNNTQYLTINLLEAPALALLLAWVFKYYKTDGLAETRYVFRDNDNIPVYLFISIIVALFLGLTVAAEEIFRDRKILKREAFLHLSQHAYLLNKVFVLFGLSAIQAAMFVLIGNRILGIEGMDFAHWAVLFSTACFANLLGLNISSAFNSAITIYILIPILLIPQLVLGGIVIRFDQINPTIRRGEAVPVFGEVMASRWGYEGLLTYQFMNNPFQQPLYDWDKTMADVDYKRLYLLPILEAKLEYCDQNRLTRHAETIITIDQELALIKTHFIEESAHLPKVRAMIPGVLDFKSYTSATTPQLSAILTALKTDYNRRFNQAYKARDLYVTRLTSDSMAAASYMSDAERYTNTAVIELAKNSRTQERIVQQEGKLTQKLYPIYLAPTPYKGLMGFRTHFYAPTKYFMGRYWPTIWFNIALIWVMTGLLYVLLYYRFLARIVQTLSRGRS